MHISGYGTPIATMHMQSFSSHVKLLYDQAMELREVLLATQILDEEIRLWETRDSRTKHTRHYIAHACGAEVGFLSVDAIPEHE